MDLEEVQKFLTETEEGKALIEGFKEPLLAKRNELFDQLSKYKTEIETVKQAEAARIAELENKQKAIVEEKLLKDNDFEAYKKHHLAEVEKMKGELQSLRQQYANKEVERVIAETAAKHSRAPKPLQLLLKERVKPVLDESGNVSLSVLGEDGKQLYWEGQPASVDYLVDTLKSIEDYQPFFAGTGASGSGTVKSETVGPNFKDMDSPSFNLTKAMQKRR